jgi:flagellar basal-body rod modification protein FlgD
MATISSVSNSLVQNAPNIPVSERVPIRTLDQDDFLKLVIAQLTSQDPMNPQSDTEFIAQMTQFTSLEQSKSMQSEIAQLRTDQQFLQANALLGRMVRLEDNQGALTQGTVSAVKIEEGTPKIVVNGQPYDLSALLTIEPADDTSKR